MCCASRWMANCRPPCRARPGSPGASSNWRCMMRPTSNAAWPWCVSRAWWSRMSRCARPTWRMCSSASWRAGGGRRNGGQTLLYKEVLRFWKVSFQTVAAPVLTAVLYLMVFGHVLDERVQVHEGVSYTAFLIPGLVMMSVLQNAFANSSSSLIQSKIMGNLVFLLLTPLSHRAWFVA